MPPGPQATAIAEHPLTLDQCCLDQRSQGLAAPNLADPAHDVLTQHPPVLG